MNVKEIDVNVITDYKNNARIHSKEQIEQIAESIKAFGFNNPVLIDKKNTKKALIALHREFKLDS